MPDFHSYAFSENFIPQVIVDREREQEIIANFLKEVANGRNSTLYIYGIPGIGKTVVTRYVTNQFEEVRENVFVIYLACSALTPANALKEVYFHICGRVGPSLDSYSMVRRVADRLMKKKHCLVIVLDNFDKMNDGERLVWKIHELMQKAVRVGLILISTNKLGLVRLLGNRLYSRLSPETLFFNPYDAETLKQILQSRIKQAFGKKIAEEKALTKIAEFIELTNGNARTMFKVFIDAMNLTQQANLKRITAKIAEEAIEQEKQNMLREKLEEIKETKPRMYEVLKIIAELSKQGEVYTGLIRERIRKAGLAVSERTLDYYLNQMEDLDLIRMDVIRKRGYTRKIRINFKVF